MTRSTPLVLMILDGWGYNSNNKYNAIAQANTPQWDEWWQNCPHILLEASGTPVGLPAQQMGNSEVGHMHIGAGRVIQQDFTRINESISTGEFVNNATLNKIIDHLSNTNKSLHVMGLLSTGGVHSHENHLFSLLELCNLKSYKSVHLHLFLDGRDTPPQSALESIERLNQVLKANPVAKINSISGRYYAMDRDRRWDRVEPVYNLLTQGIAQDHFPDAESAINTFYKKQISDEFVTPTMIGDACPIQDGDAILFFNFRADRARQLTSAFLEPDFNEFPKASTPKLSFFASMTQYDKKLDTTIVFPPIHLNNTLGEVLSAHGLRQLRIAETEKYAHVTFFLNGGSEQIFENEKRLLIPSPKVSTYDLKPEMSAPELTDVLVNAINNEEFDVVICNYANADMVGHSGNFNATLKAIECLDTCMNRIWTALHEKGGKLLITSDHGNAEEMYDDSTKQAHTAHTSEPVPFVYIGGGWHFIKDSGSLIDVAPTVLALLNIEPPSEMAGHTLLEKDHVLA